MLSVNVALKQGSTEIVPVSYVEGYEKDPKFLVALALTLKVTISGLVVSYVIAFVDGFIIIGLIPGVDPPT